MLEARRQRLWEEGGGDKFYGRLKCLEYRATNLPKLAKELKEKVASKDQEASTQESQGSEESKE